MNRLLKFMAILLGKALSLLLISVELRMAVGYEGIGGNLTQCNSCTPTELAEELRDIWQGDRWDDLGLSSLNELVDEHLLLSVSVEVDRLSLELVSSDVSEEEEEKIV